MIMDNETLVAIESTVAADIFQVLVFAVAVVGILLNATTILALLHLPWSSRPNLRLVQSLCIAHIVFLLNYIVYMITYYLNPLQSGYVATCMMFEVMRCVVYLYMYFNLTSILMDLYLAVTNPLGYASIVTTGRVYKLCVINGSFSIAIALLAVMFNYLTITVATNVHTHESSCSIYPSYLYIRSFNWIFKVSVFICIPVYVVLLIIIVLADKETNASANSSPSNTRGVVNVVLVIVTFLLCFGPHQFVSFYIQYSPESYARFKTTAKILEVLFYLDGFFTPLIYSLRMTDVKKGYTLMFKKCVTAAADYQSVFTGE